MANHLIWTQTRLSQQCAYQNRVARLCTNEQRGGSRCVGFVHVSTASINERRDNTGVAFYCCSQQRRVPAIISCGLRPERQKLSDDPASHSARVGVLPARDGWDTFLRLFDSAAK